MDYLKGPHGGVILELKIDLGNCKQLVEGDWVIPHKPGSEFGAWTSLTVVREKDLIKIPTDLMPLEYAAMHRELCVAYRLLEDHGDLKPGDAGECSV